MSAMAAGLRRFLSPRGFVYGAVLGTGMVGAQTAYLQTTYRPLDEPRRMIMQGLERFSGDEGGGETRVQAWVKGIVRRISKEELKGPLAAWMTRQKEARTKRVLIIGDSLVVGIGCEEAPVMPQAICRHLAQILGVDVAWRALGVNGGDVRTIHRNVLAAVDDFQRSHIQDRDELLLHGVAAAEPGAPSHQSDSAVLGAILEKSNVDAVVVLCGLNDFKRLWMGRTSSVFRRDLDNFLLELRSKVGEDCLVVLPAIPFEQTKFPEPLKTFAVMLATLFDEQKRAAAGEVALTHYIPKPALEFWRKARGSSGQEEIVAGDGVHPNERGYKAFAEYIADDMAQVMMLNPAKLAWQRASTSLASVAEEVHIPEWA